MDTKELVKLVNKCREIAYREGGGINSGDLSAIIPLLGSALMDESPEDIKKAILGYESN